MFQGMKESLRKNLSKNLSYFFFTAIAFTLLLSLGIWQLDRRAVKEAFLKKRQEHIEAPSISMPSEESWGQGTWEDNLYRPVSLEGSLSEEKEIAVFRVQQEGPGYFILTPLQLASGAYVLIQRGWISDRGWEARKKEKISASPLDRVVEVQGLLRASETRTFFTPEDQPAKGEWFTIESAKVAEFFHLKRMAPFFIQATEIICVTPSTPCGFSGALKVSPTLPPIPNNHLAYAFTWFSLALAVVVIFFLAIRA